MPTKRVMVGGVAIGGGAPVSVQSMTTGDIVRVAVSDEEDARALPLVKARVRVPVVADIHFSPRLAVMAVEGGADKLRINPGNIGGEKEIALVADCVKAHHIPVRVASYPRARGGEHGQHRTALFERVRKERPRSR